MRTYLFKVLFLFHLLQSLWPVLLSPLLQSLWQKNAIHGLTLSFGTNTIAKAVVQPHPSTWTEIGRWGGSQTKSRLLSEKETRDVRAKKAHSLHSYEPVFPFLSQASFAGSKAQVSSRLEYYALELFIYKYIHGLTTPSPVYHLFVQTARSWGIILNPSCTDVQADKLWCRRT